MGIISQEVLDGWIAQYDLSSPLWAACPDMLGFRDQLLERVEKDRPSVREFALGGARQALNSPVYLATAGAPLAGKSTLLDSILPDAEKEHGPFAKIDPDVWGLLRCMPNVYEWLLNEVAPLVNKTGKEAQVFAYDFARPASNSLTLECMNIAFENGYNIAHGTTNTSPHVSKLFDGLKVGEYKIDLAILGATDETREAARIYREETQGIYQATPEDVKTKGVLFPQRLKTYFDYADRTRLFWRDGATVEAKLAAEQDNGSVIKWDTDHIEKFSQLVVEGQKNLAREKQQVLAPVSLFGKYELGMRAEDVRQYIEKIPSDYPSKDL